MAETLSQYKSSLTPEEVDQALHNIAQLDDGIAQAKQYAEQAQGYAESIDPGNIYNKEQADGKFAPTNHTSSGTQYGAATDSLYGHVKLSDTAGSSGASAGVAATPKCVQDTVNNAIPDFGWYGVSCNVQNCNMQYSYISATCNYGSRLMYIAIGILGATADRNLTVATVQLPSGYSLASGNNEFGALTKSGDNSVANNASAGFWINETGDTLQIIETSTDPGGWAKAVVMLPLWKKW